MKPLPSRLLATPLGVRSLFDISSSRGVSMALPARM